MNDILNRLTQANHIVVIIPPNPSAGSFGSASAFYTYLLTLHKKVSFYCSSKSINPKLLFIPWAQKIRTSFASSADLAISFNCSAEDNIAIDIECEVINIEHSLFSKESLSTTQTLFTYFIENRININFKMATALYAGLLEDSSGFLDDRVDGTIFAVAKQLIELGADNKLCNKFIMQYMTLGAFRLKAMMLQDMQLYMNAKMAIYTLRDEDLLSSGANSDESQTLFKEALFLPTVKIALLLYQDRDLKIEAFISAEIESDIQDIRAKLKSLLSDEKNIEKAKEKALELINKETKIV